jgi:hypothetical protein
MFYKLSDITLDGKKCRKFSKFNVSFLSSILTISKNYEWLEQSMGRRLSKLFNLCLILLFIWTIKYVYSKAWVIVQHRNWGHMFVNTVSLVQSDTWVFRHPVTSNTTIYGPKVFLLTKIKPENSNILYTPTHFTGSLVSD